MNYAAFFYSLYKEYLSPIIKKDIMKTIFKTAGLCFIAGLTFSCSSDDNSPSDNNSSETLIVLDKVEKTRYSTHYSNGELTKSELFSESTYKFNYDDTGKLTTIEMDQLDEIPYEGITTKTKASIFYNEQGKVVRLYTRDIENEEDWHDETFEYNDKGLVVKSTEKVENDIKTYNYNDKNQINSIVENNKTTSNFEYDSNGNVSLAFLANDSKFQNSFMYDNKKSPYANMNIDLTYGNFEFTYILPFFQKAKNNIISYEDFNGSDNDEWVIEYEYNADNYPTKATTYYKKDRAKLGGGLHLYV